MKAEITSLIKAAWTKVSEKKHFQEVSAKFQERYQRALSRAQERDRKRKGFVDESIERVPLSGDVKTLEDIEEGDREGVKFYDTENSTFARGAEKVIPKGIDSFGEQDTFDPDEADDHQTMRDRNQNSDLTQRFGSRGLDVDLGKFPRH